MIFYTTGENINVRIINYSYERLDPKWNFQSSNKEIYSTFSTFKNYITVYSYIIYNIVKMKIYT